MVYIFIAEGFEEIEAITPLDILRSCKGEVKTVGVTGDIVTGENGITIKVDTTIDEIDINNNIKMIILPGGNPGYVNLEKNKKLIEIIKYCISSGIYIAAIGEAPTILGKMEYLKGKKAVCYPGFERDLVLANFVSDDVVIDDMIITSKAPGTAKEFAFTLAKILYGIKESNQVYEFMHHSKQYN